MMNRKNRYYRTCPCCGAHLDPGERCDCEESPVQNGGKKDRRQQEASK